LWHRTDARCRNAPRDPKPKSEPAAERQLPHLISLATDVSWRT
jgi:hypothetical protein